MLRSVPERPSPVVATAVVPDLILKVYKKGVCLGQGSFAKTVRYYKVTDVDSRSSLAVHACRTVPVKRDPDGEKSRFQYKDFVKDFFIQQSLGSHRNIVQLIDCGDDKFCYYQVLEFCDLGNLSEHLSRYEICKEDQSLFLTKQIVDGLEYIHSKGIVHLDLEPRNIFLTNTQVVKIGNFGRSRILNAAVLKECDVDGTAKYVAPEVGQGLEYSTAADIFSLGCILYEFLFGLPPSNEGLTEVNRTIGNAAHIFRESVSGKRMVVSRGAVNLVFWMLGENPVTRPTIVQIREHNFFKSHVLQFVPEWVPELEPIGVNFSDLQGWNNERLLCLRQILQNVQVKATEKKKDSKRELFYPLYSEPQDQVVGFRRFDDGMFRYTTLKGTVGICTVDNDYFISNPTSPERMHAFLQGRLFSFRKVPEILAQKLQLIGYPTKSSQSRLELSGGLMRNYVLTSVYKSDTEATFVLSNGSLQFSKQNSAFLITDNCVYWTRTEEHRNVTTAYDLAFIGSYHRESSVYSSIKQACDFIDNHVSGHKF